MFRRLRRESTRAANTIAATAPVNTAGIPKLIHVIWIGGKPFPYEENLATWKQHNPDYHVKLWTDDNLPVLHNQWLYNRLAKDESLPIALLADLLRLEILAWYGGIYTDADAWCVKPIDPLIDGLTLFGMMGNQGNVQNATLGAARHHPAYRIIIEGVGARYMRLAALARNKTQGYEIFDVFGTRYVTKILRTFPDYTQIDAGQLKGSRELICVEGQEDTSNAYIIHKNACSWKKRDGGDDRLHLKPIHPTM